MKELLTLYAKYNYQTNQEIKKIISALDEETLSKDRKTYYGSIQGLVGHIILGSWHYLHAVNMLTGGKYCYNLPALEEVNNSLKTSKGESVKYLDVLAGIFMETSESITHEYLYTRKKGVRIYNGRIIDISVWEYFLQHMTHQVHHQGQLSQLLDELQVEHEFGNIFPLFPDSTPGS
jgi:uncharacterized damage-inducible protein DinB